MRLVELGLGLDGAIACNIAQSRQLDGSSASHAMCAQHWCPHLAPVLLRRQVTRDGVHAQLALHVVVVLSHNEVGEDEHGEGVDCAQ